ncbi:MAG TPA: hypothetical protein VGG69_00540, partial [Rhizomicrobium sp.]
GRAGSAPSDRGVGEVVLQRSGTGINLMLLWAGTDSGTAIENGIATSAGTHIMYLDYGAFVELLSAANGQVQVCRKANDSDHPGNALGYVTFVY